MEFFKVTKAGETIYKSKELEELWGRGFCSIGEVTFESAAYVSRYIMKKVTGDKADAHYTRVLKFDKTTGEITKKVRLQDEYVTMSRNPAIGKEWYEQYSSDIFPHDRILLQRQGKSYINKPPRYFLKQLEKENPDMVKCIKTKRRLQAKRHKADQTPERQLVIEKCKQAQTINLNRHYEENHYES